MSKDETGNTLTTSKLLPYNIQLLSISKQNGDIDNGKLISNHNGIKLDDIGNPKIGVNFDRITKIMMEHFILIKPMSIRSLRYPFSILLALS